MPAVIAKSCNKILIGKTYWKCAALPSILDGTEAIYLSNNYLADLQIEENKALRYTVNARRKTAISALRGEFGISLQITRDMKSKILFIRHILQHNSLLREIFIHTFEEKKPTKWIKQVKKYMIDLHLTLHTIEYSKHQHIRRRIKEFDDKLWQEDLQKKSSLILYRKYKEIICDEQNLYDNSAATTTLFRARTGTLKLNIERRHTDGHTHCEICNTNATEDIEHFLLDCETLTSTRQYIIGLQKPYKENRDDHIAEFLLFGDITNQNIISRNRDDLQKLWQHRNSIILHKR